VQVHMRVRWRMGHDVVRRSVVRMRESAPA